MITAQAPQFVFEDKLYEGKYSLIYRALHQETQQKVIIKILKSDYPTQEQIGRFKHEYEVNVELFEFMPKFIIKPLHYIKWQNTYAIILEDIGAISISEWLQNNKFSLQLFLKNAIAMADALGQIHSHGIFHKDINSSNFLIQPSGSGIKIIDFGISTHLSFEWFETQSLGTIEGTLAYISPEQTGRMNRPLDYRSDYYSLGVTFYEMLTNTLPFKGIDALELIHYHLAKSPLPPCKVIDSIPKILSDIIMKLLSKTPEDRYQSIHGLLNDLKKCEDQYNRSQAILPFPLAETDVSTRFNIPEKLYGREDEIALLLNTFEKVSEGQTRLTFITGQGGIGKSSLVHELHQYIAEKRGYFLSGKGDQYKSNIPYESLVQALNKMLQQISTESSESLAEWKRILINAVGSKGQIILNLLPDVETLIGPQPTLSEVGLAESKIRFITVIQDFIQALVVDNKPVTFFFDDLQWVDQSTLELLGYLANHPRSHHLHLIGAYRASEIDQLHPLSALFEYLYKQNVDFKILEIEPLHLKSIQQLIAETLHQPLEKVKSLAELCLDKTAGNPFFINQLLTSLYKEKLIWINLKTGQWEWDLSRIQQKSITDNVVEFMSKKIQVLSSKTQETLRLASCIGNTFDINILAKINESTIPKITQDLWEAIQEGLILPLNENYKFIEDNFNIAVPYRFLHDRVQQAVYTPINEKDKEKYHKKIALTLLNSLSEEEIENNLFQIANHINLGDLSKISQNEKKIYYEINFRAALKAQSTSAFAIASTYFQKAKDLLPDQAWEKFYSSCLKLFHDFSKCLYSLGEYQNALENLKEALSHAKSPLEQAEIMSTEVIFRTEKEELEEAMNITFKSLKLLGTKLHRNPSKFAIIKEFFLTKIALKQKKIEELIQLPFMTDPKIKLIVKLMDDCAVPAYYVGDKNLVALMAIKQIRLTLKYGLSDSSCHSFFGYAMIETMAGNLDAAQKYGELALSLAETTPSKHFKGRVFALYGHVLGGWHQHWKYLKDYSKEAVRLAEQTGDVLTYRLALTFSLVWNTELPLNLFVEEGKKIITLLKRAKSPPLSVETAKMQFQMRAALCGQTKEIFDLDDDEFNEQESIERFKQNKLATGLAIFYHNRFILHYIFNDYEKSYDYLQLLEQNLEGHVGGNFEIEYTAYSFYTLSALYPKFNGIKKYKTWRRLKEIHGKFKRWSEHCPVNFLHHKFLIEAELARLTLKRDQAAQLYDRAIKAARNNEYIRYEALANELAALFYLEQGLEKNAKIYLYDAHYCYQKWGAIAKVKSLETAYGHLLPTLSVHAKTKESSTSSITGRTTSDILDILSVMKASQAITREIQLPSLIEKMMHIVIENAGADKGYLILEKEGQYYIEAEATEGNVEIVNSKPITNLPTSIINAVIHTKAPLVIDDAIHNEKFKTEEYIIQSGSRSILCFPLMNLGIMKGLLFLENSLAKGVFTQERLDIINLLSAQMAIAIDNALFYAKLEQKVEERTRELKDAQNKLIEKEKMAFLGMLTTGIGHEMKNPLNFIVNFSKFSSDLTQDLIELLAPSPDKKILEFPTLLDSLHLIKENTESIYQQGQKADTIINRMIEHSTTARQQFNQTNINYLLEQSLSVLDRRKQDLYPNVNAVIEKEFDLAMPLLKIADADIQKVFLNIFDNALYSLAKKKSISPADFIPTITITTLNKDSHCEIHIRDNGMGIEPMDQEKIFTPFFTTRPTGQGVGLGLSLCHNIIVKEHGGALKFTTQPKQFAEFTIDLPYNL